MRRGKIVAIVAIVVIVAIVASAANRKKGVIMVFVETVRTATKRLAFDLLGT